MRILLPILLIAITIAPLIRVNALPLIEVWNGNVAARQVALSRDLMAYINENGTLVIISNHSRLEIKVPEGRLIKGNGIFIQIGNGLYLIGSTGLEKIMECEGCTFFPYSRDKIAIVDSKGLLLLVNGEKKRIRVRGKVRWSENGQKISVISGDEIILLNASGRIIWRKDLNTQIFDSEPDDLTYVCMKGCEIYAINGNSFMAWTNKLCKCCIPGKLDRSGNYLLVLIQNRNLAILRAGDGRELQSLPLKGYEIDAIPGIVAIRDGNGRIHLLVDADRISLKGESGGILVTWNVPGWFKLGEVKIEHPWGNVSVPVGVNSFVPIPGYGDVNLTIRGTSGELSLTARVKPLDVTATPLGDVRVHGEGNLEVEVGGRRYPPEARVDTGWLPTYSVRVYNHGVLVAELSSMNARFLLLISSLIPVLLAIIIWRSRREFSKSEGKDAY